MNFSYSPVKHHIEVVKMSLYSMSAPSIIYTKPACPHYPPPSSLMNSGPRGPTTDQRLVYIAKFVPVVSHDCSSPPKRSAAVQQFRPSRVFRIANCWGSERPSLSWIAAHLLARSFRSVKTTTFELPDTALISCVIQGELCHSRG